MIPPDSHSVFIYRPTLELLRNELAEREHRIRFSAGTNRQCMDWNKEKQGISYRLEGEEVSGCYAKGGNYVRVVAHGAEGHSASTFVNPDHVDIKQEKRFLKKFLRRKSKGATPLSRATSSTPKPTPTADKWDGMPTSVLVELDGVERELIFENLGCALALDGRNGQAVQIRAVGSREAARIWVLDGPRNNLDNFDESADVCPRQVTGHEGVSFTTVAAAR